MRNGGVWLCSDTSWDVPHWRRWRPSPRQTRFSAGTASCRHADVRRTDRELRSRKSVDSGATFAPFTKVADVFPIGDSFAIRGGFRTFLDLQSLAIDRSRGSSRGDVYAAFHDGSAVTLPDAFSDTGVYGFADVMVSRSRDGSATWDPPIKVNDNVEVGFGTDQYQPSVAVDLEGRVGSCFYDRRRDPANFQIDRFCTISNDGGQTWSANTRQTARSFMPSYLHRHSGLLRASSRHSRR